MKTINQMAASLGVTRQTIYNAVKSEGLTLDSFTTEKRGNTRLFDTAAEKRVKDLLSKKHQKPVKNDTVKLYSLTADLAAARAKVEQLTADLEAAKKESAASAEQLEAAQERNEQLTADLARANNRIDALLQMGLDKANRALPAGKEPGRIRKAWRVLTGKAEG